MMRVHQEIENHSLFWPFLRQQFHKILPVTLAYLHNDDTTFMFLDKFAMYVLGDNFCIVLQKSDYFRLKDDNTAYCVFFHKAFGKKRMLFRLTFGANYGPNRSTSFLLHKCTAAR